MLVQPVNGLLVFFSSFSDEPHYVFCFKPSCIGNQLAQVVVIRGLQLVFDNDFLAGIFLLPENINVIPADMSLCLYQFDSDADFIAEQLKIVGL